MKMDQEPGTPRLLRPTKVPFTPSVSNNSTMTLAILLTLEPMESLQIRIETHFEATPLFSMRAVLLASSQSCHSIDADVWCKRALNPPMFMVGDM